MKKEIKQRIDDYQSGNVTRFFTHSCIGIICKDWKECHLINVIEEHCERIQKTDDIPLYSLTIEDGVIPKSSRYERSFLITKDEDGYKLVKPNEFVSNPMNLRFGAISLYRGEHNICVSGYYDVFKVKRGYNPILLEALFRSTQMLNYYNRMATGSLIEKQRVHFSQFINFRLPIPPLPEQEAIAEILSTCDRVLSLKRELLSELQKRKKWLMQKLLDPNSGIRLPGFKGKWEKKRLGEIFEFKSNMSASRSQLGETGVCYLHYGDIHKCNSTNIHVDDSINDIPKIQISDEKIHKYYLLQDGDVVFVDASEDYIGACKYVVIENQNNVPFISGLHTLPAHSITNHIDNKFKRYCFQTTFVQNQMIHLLNGMKVYGLTKATITKIIVQFPSLPEQTAIANVLSTADRAIELVEEEIQSWELKKKSLMQLLLTGIVRTV